MLLLKSSSETCVIRNPNCSCLESIITSVISHHPPTPTEIKTNLKTRFSSGPVGCGCKIHISTQDNCLLVHMLGYEYIYRLDFYYFPHFRIIGLKNFAI